MIKKLIQLMFIVSIIVQLPACTTAGRRIETPSGQVGSVDGNLVILRVVRKTTTTGNMPDARSGIVDEDIVMSCPEGTVTAIPVLEQTAFGYGEIDPDDLSAVDSLGVISVTWSRPKQRPLGMYHAGIHVTDVNAPPPGGGEQTVTLKASAYLTDDNSDDQWWQISTYHVLCLGNPPPG